MNSSRSIWTNLGLDGRNNNKYNVYIKVTDKDDFWISLDLTGATRPDGSVASAPHWPLLQEQILRPAYVELVSDIDGVQLEWAWANDDYPDCRLIPSLDGPLLLDRFLRLGDYSAGELHKRILSFARKWGVLGLCSHGLPWTHGVQCNDSGPTEKVHSEDVNLWSAYIARARALVALGIKLHSHSVSKSEWATLELSSSIPRDVGLGLGSPEEYPESLRWQRYDVARLASRWLHLAGVRTHLEWRYGEESPRVSLALGDVTAFGYLATQLAFTIARAPGQIVAACYSCGEPVVKSRGYRPTMRAFCTKNECQRTARRLRQRDYRNGISHWKRGKGTDNGEA